MNEYNVTIKKISINEYVTQANSKEEAIESVMEFCMLESDDEDTKNIIEIEID